MNKVCLIGRLTKEPTLKKTANDISTTYSTLAVNRAFKNADGKYDADFINIVAWRHNADFLCKYVNKGDQVGIEGRIQTRTFESEEKGKIYITEVLVEQVTLLGGKKETTKNEAVVSEENDPFSDFGESVEIDESFLD